MTRTNSRKISRRGVKKKTPFFGILLVFYIAGLGMWYVGLHMKSSQLSYSLEEKRAAVAESRNRVRNLKAEVEKSTGRSFVLRKVEEFNLGLQDPLPGQVVHVRHFQSGELPVQKLRGADSARATTIASSTR